MKRCYRSWIVFLTVLMELCLFVSRSSAAEPLPLGPVDTGGPLDQDTDWVWVNPVPFMNAIDPNKIWELPADWDRPLLREREAVLVTPSNGRELVDQALAQEERPGLPIAAGTTRAASPLRLFHRQRVAPNFVLPVASGV
jgi:hypothetical protein